MLPRHHRFDCRVLDLLGSGGQGEVYRVEARDGARVQRFALKWYYPEWANPEHFEALRRLTTSTPPGPRFLWPLDLVIVPGRPEFGYLMELRPARFAACSEIMSRRVQIGFRQVVLACLNLADGFLGLHARGMCYRDISFGNVFVDAASGEVLICDNDNVGFEGSTEEGIRGTDGFMAPEVVLGTARPSASTDLYSLSVLLFYLLMMHHPLEGRRLSGLGLLGRDEAREVFGRNPLFIFDPKNTDNCPDPRDWQSGSNALTFWPLYPQFVRDLFTRAFTDGLRDPRDGRVRESQWREAMAQLLDLILPCRCGAEVFADLDGQQPRPCWSCSRSAEAGSGLPRLLIGEPPERITVLLHEGKQLFDHHLGVKPFDYTRPTALVVPHPRARGVCGLRNLTETTWQAYPLGGGDAVPIPPQRSVTLVAGTRIAFVGADGKLAP